MALLSTSKGELDLDVRNRVEMLQKQLTNDRHMPMLTVLDGITPDEVVAVVSLELQPTGAMIEGSTTADSADQSLHLFAISIQNTVFLTSLEGNMETVGVDTRV